MQFSVEFVGEPAVVVSFAVFERREIVLDAFAEGVFRCEVHGRSGYWLHGTGGNQCVVGGEPAGAIEREHMVEATAAVVAVEIEIGVVGEVYHRGGIGCCFIADLECVIVVQCVSHRYFDIGRVAGVSIGTFKGERHPAFALHGTIPDTVLVSVRAAVEVIGAVVDGECVFFPVDREMPTGNAVGISARCLSRTRPVGEVVGGVVISDGDIRERAVGVGEFYCHDARAKRREGHLCPIVVGQCYPCYVAFGRGKCLLLYFHDMW